jgi:REP element-mobilizing transposase RayT
MPRPNTFTQVHLQFVFAPRYRAALIRPHLREGFHRYATGIIQENKHKLLQINSMEDHTHILIGMRTHQGIAGIVQNLKTETSKWFKLQQGRHEQPFAWQEGYGAFSYSSWDVENVIRYIQNQEAHHQRESFLDEYRYMLTQSNIDWNDEFIFREPE